MDALAGIRSCLSLLGTGGDVEDGFGPSEQRATRQPNRKNFSTKSLDGNVRATSYTKENSLHGQSPNDAQLSDQGHAVVPDYMHNDSSMYLLILFTCTRLPMSVSSLLFC